MIKAVLPPCSILRPPLRMRMDSGSWKQHAHMEWSSLVKYVVGTNFLIWSFISVTAKGHTWPPHLQQKGQSKQLS